MKYIELIVLGGVFLITISMMFWMLRDIGRDVMASRAQNKQKKRRKNLRPVGGGKKKPQTQGVEVQKVPYLRAVK